MEAPPNFFPITTAVSLAVTAGALILLVWSWRRGHLRAMNRGATSIFDEREPVGRMTDRFPKNRAEKEAAGGR